MILLVMWYCLGWAAVAYHCKHNEKLTLCDFLAHMIAGGLQNLMAVWFGGLIVGFMIYVIIYKTIYVFAAVGVIYAISLLFHFVPKVDVTKFCLILWQKPKE